MVQANGRNYEHSQYLGLIRIFILFEVVILPFEFIYTIETINKNLVVKQLRSQQLII